MKTRFLATTALVLSLALPGALAAQTSGTTGTSQPTQSQSGTMRAATIDDGIVGKDLYGANNQEVGEIDDVVMGQDGKVESVLVDVGGFLGMGSKRVAIPVDEIEMNGERVVATGLTKERAESMAEHDGTTARTTDTQRTDTQRTTSATGTTTGSTMGTTNRSTTGTGTAASGTAAGTGAATTGRAVTAERMIDRTVIGRDLYGANDEEVGEIEDVVMGTSGDVESVLIDIGGFLGMGAKRVAIPVDQISMEGDRLVASRLTKAEAEAMPEYQQ